MNEKPIEDYERDCSRDRAIINFEKREIVEEAFKEDVLPAIIKIELPKNHESKLQIDTLPF